MSGLRRKVQALKRDRPEGASAQARPGKRSSATDRKGQALKRDRPSDHAPSAQAAANGSQHGLLGDHSEIAVNHIAPETDGGVTSNKLAGNYNRRHNDGGLQGDPAQPLLYTDELRFADEQLIDVMRKSKELALERVCS